MSNFFNPTDIYDGIDIAILEDAEALNLVDAYGNEILQEANYNREIKKVLITKEQKFNKLKRNAVFYLARLNNDPEYLAWLKATKAAKQHRIKLEQKYRSKAIARAKNVIANAKGVVQAKKFHDLPKK